MKKFLTLLTILSILASCSSKKINGTYFYTELPVDANKKESLLSPTFGKEIVCSNIGKFEFRDASVYFTTMGVEVRSDYDIDNNVIYLKNNYFEQGNTGFMRVIDDNTIRYLDCTFKKYDFAKIGVAVTKSNVDLKIGPGNDYEKSKNVKKGTEVYILDDKKEWILVRVDRKEGYIIEIFLSWQTVIENIVFLITT